MQRIAILGLRLSLAGHFQYLRGLPPYASFPPPAGSPSLPVMPISASLAQQIAALAAHYDAAVLPPWRRAGWNDTLRLPYESLDAASGQALPAQRYRAMACARQLYVHALAGETVHAGALFDSLSRHFGDGQGGWIYSVDAAGAPLDATRDLYTHAFVIFASAAWHRSRGAGALQVLRQTVDVVEQRFGDGNGLYHAALGKGFDEIGAGVLQNPIMHLTEAYLAAHAATGDPWFAQRLGELAHAVRACFVDPATGCIAELPQGAAGNRVEPGHQFEWYSLLVASPAVFAGHPLVADLRRAFDFARRHGVVAGTLGVSAALDAGGAVSDSTQRIWAQTAYARALALHGDAAALADLEAWCGQFRRRFLHAGGWHECLAADGSVTRTDMPSTTPYHLATAYLSLKALA